VCCRCESSKVFKSLHRPRHTVILCHLQTLHCGNARFVGSRPLQGCKACQVMCWPWHRPGALWPMFCNTGDMNSRFDLDSCSDTFRSWRQAHTRRIRERLPSRPVSSVISAGTRRQAVRCVLSVHQIVGQHWAAARANAMLGFRDPMEALAR